MVIGRTLILSDITKSYLHGLYIIQMPTVGKKKER